MIPDYLKKHMKNVKEKKNVTKGIIVSSTNNELLKIKYYGSIEKIRRNYYIMDGKLPCMIVAFDPITNENILLYDGYLHGYDNLFCNEYDKSKMNDRTLETFNHSEGKIEITLGYSIDYEDEKDGFEYNEKGEVILIDGSSITFDMLKQIGYDWINIRFITNKKQEIFDMELA